MLRIDSLKILAPLIIWVCSLSSSVDASRSDTYVYDTEDFGRYSRELVYLGGGDDSEEIIPFYLSYPKQREVKGVVIFLHGITSHKDVWWQGSGPYSSRREYLEAFIDKGIAVAAIDARFHGQRANKLSYKNPKTELFYKMNEEMIAEMLKGTVEDCKTVISYIQSREEFESIEFGVLGDSMGGIIALPLAVEDDRVGFIVSLVASPNPMPNSKLVSSISPMGLANRVEKPIFILSSKNDDYYSSEDMKAFYQKIKTKDKKHLEITEGHDFKNTHADDISSWVVKQLASHQ